MLSWEYLATLGGMCGYVFFRERKTQSIFKSCMLTGISLSLAYGTSGKISEVTGIDLLIVSIMVMAFGRLILDVSVFLLEDKEALKKVFLARLYNKQGKSSDDLP